MAQVFLVVGMFIALSFGVCFMSFLYYYACQRSLSTRDDGQLRSLSGIMKTSETKPYFCFVMGCLGSSLFIAAGAGSFTEQTDFQRDFILVLSLGMYACLIGVVNYDLTFSKGVHLSFVFALIVLGLIFSFIALGRRVEPSFFFFWNIRVASVLYDVSIALFVMCCLLNSYMKSHGFNTIYRTTQSYLEICWVISLVFMLSMYAFEPAKEGRLVGPTTLLHFFLAVTVVSCGFLLSLFYATPGLGYDNSNNRKGGIECVCYVIAMTAPHYTFMLHILSGLLSLSLVMKQTSHLLLSSSSDGHNNNTPSSSSLVLLLAIIFQICFTGLLSFDLIHHGKAHTWFVLVLFIASLSFSWCVPDWGDAWHRAGIVVFNVASIAMIVISPITVYFFSKTDAAFDIVYHIEIAWVIAMVFMFGVYVFL